MSYSLNQGDYIKATGSIDVDAVLAVFPLMLNDLATMHAALEQREISKEDKAAEKTVNELELKLSSDLRNIVKRLNPRMVGTSLRLGRRPNFVYFNLVLDGNTTLWQPIFRDLTDIMDLVEDYPRG